MKIWVMNLRGRIRVDIMISIGIKFGMKLGEFYDSIMIEMSSVKKYWWLKKKIKSR